MRARWYLYPETEQDDENTARTRRTGKRTLELQKSNLGKTDQMLTFAWDDDARMFLPNSTFGGSRIDRKHRDDTEQSGLVLTLTTCCRANIIVPAADRGQRTAFNVLAKRPEFPASLKGSSKRFWPHRGAAAITPHRGIRISPHRPSLRSRIASHFRLMRACGQYPFKVCPHIAISPSAGLAGQFRIGVWGDCIHRTHDDDDRATEVDDYLEQDCQCLICGRLFLSATRSDAPTG